MLSTYMTLNTEKIMRRNLKKHIGAPSGLFYNYVPYKTFQGKCIFLA